MPERLVNKADFERLLGQRPWARSTHFAVHHLPCVPQRPVRLIKNTLAAELSTATAPGCPQPVDDLPQSHWLGCVVPKRHARRAVTRSLLKRQARSAFLRHLATLPQGLWLLRLRQPFGVTAFPSAHSSALVQAARLELDSLLTQARR